ncbi:phosphoribosylamine--glycine ligase [Chloroflexi bacterium TSY]|nr:phosphoribosylamine--glycine ligase [Chloroflexi bacterium TSY]
MKVLVIGSGGREHALAWTISRSSHVTKLFVAPGNGGTAMLPDTENIAIEVDNLPALLDFAQRESIDLAVVGPELPLVLGIVDLFQAQGIRIFGPSRTAARLEGSKAFAKEFMQRHNLPTGQAEIFDDFDEATRYLRTLDDLPVVKASGLAAGKGVLLPETMEETAQILHQILEEGRFGDAGKQVLVEERLSGPEMSVLAFCDGEEFRMMPVAQDHKRLRERNRGPNTGGMGAFVPAPSASPKLLKRVEREILRPTLAGMASEGTPYKGVLYAGLMLTKSGPKLLEFNCRFGDPEAQVVLPLLKGDLVEVMLACIDGKLDQIPLMLATKSNERDQAGVTIVMASNGYPDEYTIGVEITGIDQAEASGCLVFQAGTKIKDGRLLTDGGRVLAVTALANELSEAATVAYDGVSKINFNYAQYRRDIARRHWA